MDQRIPGEDLLFLQREVQARLRESPLTLRQIEPPRHPHLFSPHPRPHHKLLIKNKHNPILDETQNTPIPHLRPQTEDLQLDASPIRRQVQMLPVPEGVPALRHGYVQALQEGQ